MKTKKQLQAGGCLLVIIGVMVAFATVLTWALPCYTIDLTRNNGRVDAVVTQKLAFVFDLKISRVEGLTDTSSTTYQPPAEDYPGSVDDMRQRGSDRRVTPDMEGHLILEQAGGHAIELQVTPQQLEDVRRAIRDFLKGSAPTFHQWVVANWKAAVIVPVILYGLASLMLAVLILDLFLSAFFPQLGKDWKSNKTSTHWAGPGAP